MKKKDEIIVNEMVIQTMKINCVDYISITDIAKLKNATDPNGVVANWMRTLSSNPSNSPPP